MFCLTVAPPIPEINADYEFFLKGNILADNRSSFLEQRIMFQPAKDVFQGVSMDTLNYR